MSVRPADFPPPFDAAEFVAEPTDPPDERIDVGVLVVGGGPAGLSAAIRVDQLLEEDPAVRERLGEIPVAIVEKGKAPGAHLLSGAVVNPRAFRQLFPGMHTEDMPFRSRVEREGVYYLTAKRAIRVPAPPTMWNHGNYVASISEIGALAGRARRGGRGDARPRDGGAHAPRLRRPRRRHPHRRPGTRPRRRGAAELRAGLGHHRARHDPRRGDAGPPGRRRLERFGLPSRPQVWALGVKEVWEVPQPLNRVIHTMGWPLRAGEALPRVRRQLHLPARRRQVAIGMVVGLDYTDASLSVHDLLQELKTHPFVRGHPRGRQARRLGGEDDPRGRLPRAPGPVLLPGRDDRRRRRRLRERAGAQGHPLRDDVGHARCRDGGRGGRPGRDLLGAGCARRLRRRGARELHLERPPPRPQHAARVQARLLPRRARGRRRASPRSASCRPGTKELERDADVPVAIGDRAKAYPAPDGKLVFDKLSSVYLSGNKTRDDAPSHIRVDTQGPARGGRGLGAHVPGAGVRGRRARPAPPGTSSTSR